VVALDGPTGALRWEQRIAKPSLDETLTMQPLVWDSLIFIGPAGSEDGVRGWIGAFRVRDGAPVWRFNTIEPSTWGTENPGGASVWTRFSIDTLTERCTRPPQTRLPILRRIFSPDRTSTRDSVVALDATPGRSGTGSLSRTTRMIGILTQAGPLVGDRIVAAGKDGIVRMLDRSDGTARWATAVSERRNTSAAVTTMGTHVCPRRVRRRHVESAGRLQREDRPAVRAVD
jgi:alcohol dehydrogenase (cytochrome c)